MMKKTIIPFIENSSTGMVYKEHSPHKTTTVKFMKNLLQKKNQNEQKKGVEV